LGWLDGFSLNGLLQGVSAVAAAVSAIGACVAARATYRSIEQPAEERRQEARAIAIAALDGFVAKLVSMRATFEVNSLIVSQSRRFHAEGKRDDLVQGIRSISGVAEVVDIPMLPPGFHNLDLVLALNRLRESVIQWSVITSSFTFELHSVFDDKETLELRALEVLEASHTRVMNDMRILGGLLGDLLPLRKEELSRVVHTSNGFVIEKFPL
jgi:transcriptional regulator of aromatic amino acid metabolism